MTVEDDASTPRIGRRPSTSHAEIEATAFALFVERGYDETSVEDIAGAVGIAKRTFFRYFSSKADVVWGDFDSELTGLRTFLDDVDPSIALMEAVHQAVLQFNRVPADQLDQHRRRMCLLLQTETLLANSTLRFVQWRQVIAEFAARRLGEVPEDLLPSVIAYSALGATLAGYEQWLRDDTSDLTALLDEALGELAIGFSHHGVE